MSDDDIDETTAELEELLEFQAWQTRKREQYRHERLLELMEGRLQKFEATGEDPYDDMLPWSSPVLSMVELLDGEAIGWAPRHSIWYSRVHWLQRFQDARQDFKPEEIQPIYRHFHIGGVQ